MGSVRRTVDLPGPIAAVEALFLDLSRRPAYVEGFAHVAKRDGPWPDVGGRVLWDSPRGGRGRVSEQVLAREGRVSHTCAIEDERLRGTQEVTFALREDGTTVRLAVQLRWEVKVPKGVAALHDLFVVRRRVGEDLRRTLVRLRNERLSDLEDERTAAAT